MLISSLPMRPRDQNKAGEFRIDMGGVSVLSDLLRREFICIQRNHFLANAMHNFMLYQYIPTEYFGLLADS